MESLNLTAINLHSTVSRPRAISRRAVIYHCEEKYGAASICHDTRVWAGLILSHLKIGIESSPTSHKPSMSITIFKRDTDWLYSIERCHRLTWRHTFPRRGKSWKDFYVREGPVKNSRRILFGDFNGRVGENATRFNCGLPLLNPMCHLLLVDTRQLSHTHLRRTYEWRLHQLPQSGTYDTYTYDTWRYGFQSFMYKLLQQVTKRFCVVSVSAVALM